MGSPTFLTHAIYHKYFFALTKMIRLPCWSLPVIEGCRIFPHRLEVIRVRQTSFKNIYEETICRKPMSCQNNGL